LGRTILDVRNLKTYFYTKSGVVRAVDGVSLSVKEREIVGLVGESGCGKSVTALSIMRLVPEPGKIVEGEIYFMDKNILALTDEEIRKIRGKEMAMIFQNPSSSLNPVFTTGYQVAEPIMLHLLKSKEEASTLTTQLFNKVEISDPQRRTREYPHQLSGGMKQRVMIAMAISCKPKLLIADEPTTALDVTVQAQIMNLIRELRNDIGSAILLITHDMGLVAENCDRVAVMYAGKIVESAPVEEIFSDPKHPYTQLLLSSIPRPDRDIDKLTVIKGEVPDPISPPPGCRFAPRCPYVMDICIEKYPTMLSINDNHLAACHLYINKSDDV
jgi:peptide/nickel transport system ATP-binding protein